jgi:hypothetical protein
MAEYARYCLAVGIHYILIRRTGRGVKIVTRRKSGVSEFKEALLNG